MQREVDNFIVDDDDEELQNELDEHERKKIKRFNKIHRYAYKEETSEDESMEAGFDQIQREEARSAAIARREDFIELQKLHKRR